MYFEFERFEIEAFLAAFIRNTLDFLMIGLHQQNSESACNLPADAVNFVRQRASKRLRELVGCVDANANSLVIGTLPIVGEERLGILFPLFLVYSLDFVRNQTLQKADSAAYRMTVLYPDL